MPADASAALRQHILGQLEQGPLEPYKLDLAGYDAALLESVIDCMRAAGEITFDGLFLKITSVGSVSPRETGVSPRDTGVSLRETEK